MWGGMDIGTKGQRKPRRYGRCHEWMEDTTREWEGAPGAGGHRGLWGSEGGQLAIGWLQAAQSIAALGQGAAPLLPVQRCDINGKS